MVSVSQNSKRFKSYAASSLPSSLISQSDLAKQLARHMTCCEMSEEN